MSISIRLDAHELIERMTFASREAFNAIRSGLAKGAREARKDALETFASDANVTNARAKRAQPTVKIDGLVASWSPSKSAANIASTAGANSTRKGGLTASTFTITGGGSASLVARHGFILKLGSASVALNRVTFGPGSHRGGLKKVFAENAQSGIGQTDGAPRKTWERVAPIAVETAISAALQSVLDGYGVRGDSGGE